MSPVTAAFGWQASATLGPSLGGLIAGAGNSIFIQLANMAFNKMAIRLNSWVRSGTALRKVME